MNPRTRFVLPPELAATEPPEQRGLARDEVRLLVAESGRPIRHTAFREIAAFLRPGDLVVVNTSGTRASAVDGRRADGRPVTVHFSHRVPHGDRWVVELRTPGGVARIVDAHVGEQVRLPCGVTATLLAAQPDPARRSGSRLWLARIPVEGGVAGWLERVGHPISYGYLPVRPPLSAFQTVFARDPGSAEMPSAGRPFSARVLADLARHGVAVAEVTLHTGVSSTEPGETPPPEWYRVAHAVAQQVNPTHTRRAGDRGRYDRRSRAGERLRSTRTTRRGRRLDRAGLGPDRAPRVVDGLITGWHEPSASHLLLLEAVAGPEVVGRAYAAALAARYRWHEFGDSCLFLRPREDARPGLRT